MDIEQHGEYITMVSGRIGPYKTETAKHRRTIRRPGPYKWGPYGAIPTRLNKHCRLPAFGGQIVGFYGRCGECLDAIRVYVQVKLVNFTIVDWITILVFSTNL